LDLERHSDPDRIAGPDGREVFVPSPSIDSVEAVDVVVVDVGDLELLRTMPFAVLEDIDGGRHFGRCALAVEHTVVGAQDVEAVYGGKCPEEPWPAPIRHEVVPKRC